MNPSYTPPKEQSFHPVSPDLDNIPISHNDEDTTKTLDGPSIIENTKIGDIQKKFDGTLEVQLETLNARVKMLTEKHKILEKKYDAVKEERDKNKKMICTYIKKIISTGAVFKKEFKQEEIIN